MATGSSIPDRLLSSAGCVYLCEISERSRRILKINVYALHACERRLPTIFRNLHFPRMSPRRDYQAILTSIFFYFAGKRAGVGSQRIDSASKPPAVCAPALPPSTPASNPLALQDHFRQLELLIRNFFSGPQSIHVSSALVSFENVSDTNSPRMSH